MGKSKAHRTKGNLQPSSSAKAAELVAKTSGSVPSQFFVLSKYLKNSNDEADLSFPSDTELCYVFKKLSKKDVTTKKKALQEFGQLCLEKERDDLIASLPYWVPIYSKLALDNDRWVRQLCQESFQKLAGSVRNHLAPHLKGVMGTWLMAQCDGHASCSSVARHTFETMFKEAKQSEAVWFCKSEIVKLLVDILFNTTKESIKESDVCDDEEIEGRLVRLQTAALDALSRFVKLSDLQYSEQVAESLDAILNHSNFWKLHKHQSPSVRRAFFDSVAALCDRGTFGDDSVYKEQVVRSVLLSVDESDPHGVPALWKALVAVSSIKDCWLLVNMRKAFLPKLFSFLESGGHGCSEVVFPNVVVVLDKLPPELRTEEKFSSRFLDKLRKGLRQHSVMMSHRESEAIVKSYVDCCKYFAFQFVEKTDPPDLVSASHIVRDQIVDLLRESLIETKQNLHCCFKQVSEFLWYLHEMSVRRDDGEGDDRKSSSLWAHVSKSALDETRILSEKLMEDREIGDESLEKLNVFLRMFLHCQDGEESLDGHKQSRTLRRGVTFDLPSANTSRNDDRVAKSAKVEVDAKETYKTHEAFRDFVHRLSAALYSEVKLDGSGPSRMKLFRTLFEQFACDEFLENLKPPPSDGDEVPEDSPAVHLFLKDVVSVWMASSAARSSAFSEVVRIFVAALRLESEEEGKHDFELALEGFGGKGERAYECLSLLIGSSDERLSRLWTSSERCVEIVESSVADCVESFSKCSVHEQSWDLLVSVLTRRESEGRALSVTKNRLLVRLEEHLLALARKPENRDRAFRFVEILVSQMLERNSVADLGSCESFNWLVDALLWASVGAVAGVSAEARISSRRTLVSTLDVLFASRQKDEKSFEDSKLSLELKSFLPNYVIDFVSAHERLDDVVDTYEEILKKICIHFEDFNFLTDFVAPRSRKDQNSVDSLPSERSIEKLSQLTCEGGCSPEPRKERNELFLNVVYCRLYNRLTDVPKSDAPVAGSDLEEESSLTVSKSSKGALTSGLIETIRSKCAWNNEDPQSLAFVVDTLDCLCRATFGKIGDEATRDLTSSLTKLVPLLSTASLCKLVGTKMDGCLGSPDGRGLDAGGMSLFFLLELVASDDVPRKITAVVEQEVFQRIIEVADVSAKLLKVVTAVLPFLPEKNVQQLFDKFLHAIKEVSIKSEKDLTDSFVNSFSIANAIVSAKKKFLVETSDSAAAVKNSVSRNDDDDDTKTLDLLSAKINSVKDFCEGLFEEGAFNGRVAELNVLAIDFYKNFVASFGSRPDVIRKHWDDVLCFVVSRFEGLNDFRDSSDFQFSPRFASFLEAILSQVLEMMELFDSKEFKEHSPGLADEWKNVFQPTLFEYLNPFFLGTVTANDPKAFEHPDVLELLCEVVSRCPPEHFSHFHASASGEGEDPEPLFQLMCPLLLSSSSSSGGGAGRDGCVRAAAHAVLKKVVPRKVEFLRRKFSGENNELAATVGNGSVNGDQDQDESPKYTNPAAFVPSLVEAFDASAARFRESLPENPSVFGSASVIPRSRSEALSYALCCDLIFDVLNSSPRAVKKSLLSWFAIEHVDWHMASITSTMTCKPSDHLLQTAHEDLVLDVSSVKKKKKKKGTLLDYSLFSNLGPEADDFDRFMSEQESAELSYRVFVRTLHCMPRVVRTWHSNLDQKFASVVEKFVIKNVSPGYISRELSLVQQTTLNRSDLNFQVKRHSKELAAVYSSEDATVSLIVNFPDNAPLSCLKVSLDHNRIMSVKQLSPTWLLQLTKLLNYKDGTLTEALLLLGRSLERHFDGQSCMICFSLVLPHQGTKVLPRMQCKTCKKRFHNFCLFTWFKSSHNSACPLCRGSF